MEFNLKGNVVIGHKSLPDWVHCDEAKQLLDEAGESYTYVTSDKWFFGELMQKTSSKNVPQIIMKGEYIGGTPELKTYLENKWNPWYKAHHWTSTSGRIVLVQTGTNTQLPVYSMVRKVW